MTSNTVHVQKETFKQLAGEQCKVICGAWASKHTYITVIYYNINNINWNIYYITVIYYNINNINWNIYYNINWNKLKLVPVKSCQKWLLFGSAIQLI